MSAYIQRPDGSFLYFDLTVDERHGGTAIVTKLPVEEGPDVNDHVRVEARPLTVRCFITNTPLEPSGNQPGLKRGSASKGQVTIDITPYKPQQSLAASVASAVVNPVGFVTDAIKGDPGKKEIKIDVLKFDTAFDTNADTFFTLKDMQDKAERLTVFTSVAEYSDMILERFEVVRTSETGNGSDVDLVFAPLNIVRVETAATPVSTEPQVKQVKKAGKKDPEPEVPRASILKNGAQKDTNVNLFTGKPE